MRRCADVIVWRDDTVIINDTRHFRVRPVVRNLRCRCLGERTYGKCAGNNNNADNNQQQLRNRSFFCHTFIIPHLKTGYGRLFIGVWYYVLLEPFSNRIPDLPRPAGSALPARVLGKRCLYTISELFSVSSHDRNRSFFYNFLGTRVTAYSLITRVMPIKNCPGGVVTFQTLRVRPRKGIWANFWECR